MKNYSIILIAFLLWHSGSVYAQYTGGSGRGDVQLGITGFSFPTSGFAGGNGRGDAASTKASTCLGGDPVTWYLDADNDGWYVATQSACTSPGAGWTSTLPGGGSGDCDDNDNTKWQSATLYIDNDNDGYDAGTALVCYGATVPSGYNLTTLGSDCDDNDANVWQNGQFYVDADGDGFGAGSLVTVCYGSTTPAGYSTNNTDCAPADATKWQLLSGYVDADGDGYTVGAQIQVCSGASLPSGYSATSLGTDCDDNDDTKWQSATLFIDNDNDGYDAGTALVCYGATVPSGYSLTTLGSDCDDNNASINPGATEICGNGIDEDCSGSDLACSGANTWLGTALGDENNWHNAANWSAGIPNCASDVIVPLTANQPMLNTDGAVGNLTLANNVHIEICSSCRLSVCGDITGSTSGSAYFDGNGPVVLSGSSPQTISGRSTYTQLRLDNADGAALAAAAQVNINAVLELETGILTTTGGTLRLKSNDETHAAIIDNFSTGFSGTLSGNITAERGYAASQAVQLHKQHYFGTPIINLPITQFAPAKGTNGVAVTPLPDCDELNTATGGNYGNVFEFDESTVTTCHLEGWIVRSSGITEAGRGYSVVKNGSGVLSQTGLPRMGGDVLRSGLTNSGWISGPTPQNNTYFSGWHLLGNPYPASIDLSYTGTNTNFDDEILVMHTTGQLAGTLQPLAMSGTGILPPFQGFLAKKSLIGGTATFTFSDTTRRTTQTTFQKNEWKRQMSLKVIGNGFSDVTYFNFIADATDAYDPAFDGAKIPGMAGQPTIYSLIGSEWASVNSQQSVETVQPIPVGFVPGNNGFFTIEAEGFEELENTTVFLEDKKENIMHNLTQTPDYIFTASKTDQRERFVLHFNYQQPSGLTNNGNPSSNIRLFPNPASSLVYVESQEPAAKNQELNVEVFDINGRRVNATFKPATSGAGTLDVSLLPSAVYQVRITGAGGNVVKRLVKE